MPHTPPPVPPAPPPVDWIDPRHEPEHPAVRDWQAQIAAGRIGTPSAADPALAVIHAANAALIARRRREDRA